MPGPSGPPGPPGVPPPDLLPVGAVIPYTGIDPPSSWLLCDGKSYDPNTYTTLFNVIKYTFGQDGINFRVPDLKGKTVVGVNATYTLGSSAGSSTVKLNVSNIPSHTHTGTTNNNGVHSHSMQVSGMHSHGMNVSGNHSHGMAGSGEHSHGHDGMKRFGGGCDGTGFAHGSRTWIPNCADNGNIFNGGNHTHSIYDSGNHTHGIQDSGNHSHNINDSGAHNHTFTTDGTGESKEFNVMNPYVSLNYIIKAK